MDILKSLKMLDEQTVEIVYLDNINIDLEGMQAAWIRLDEFTNKKRLKKLIIVGRNTGITFDARKYAQTEGKARSKFTIAEAMVVHTLPQKMAANFYDSFIKNLFPVRYFTDIKKAKDWLNTI